MAETKQKERNIAELYKALKEKNKYLAQVRDDEPPDDPLQRISKWYNNTFLHMAIRFKRKDLVGELLRILLKEGNHPFWKTKNNEGNTILHEVASSDTMIDEAKEMVNSDPDLLFEHNDLGETPIFCASRHGQTEMFQFLAEKMKLTKDGPEDCKPYLRRKDRTTVLHISITTECFKLAHTIADAYNYLIVERDQDSMTALQYLACNPTAFGRKKMKMGQGFMEELMRSTHQAHSLMEKLPNWFPKDSRKTSDERCPLVLKKLVKLLVEKDTSWHASVNSQAVDRDKTKELEIELSQKNNGQDSEEKERKISQENKGEKSEEKKGQNSQGNDGQDFEYKKSDETPLFLATISNIPEIVEEILIYYPQMLEHTNKEGKNILQLAILYRHNEIFDMVVNSEVFPRSLLSATDNEGNSLLHVVGQKRKSQASERMQSPAFQLRKELLFFQNVKSASKMHLTKPLNNKNKTAEELFASTNEDLHREAKEWLMRTTENCTILSVFIATVAFAAAYTVPGGSDGSTGIPILHSKPFFVVFIIADVISLTLALKSVGIFLSILTSSFPLQHFKTYLFENLKQGIICMIASVTMMAVAFGATIVLVMTHNRENVVWYVVAFLPVPICFVSYSPLRSVFLRRCTEWFKNFVQKFLKGVAIAVLIFLVLLFYLLYKACEFICKPVCWICGNKSQPKSDTQSPQPNAAPLDP